MFRKFMMPLAIGLVLIFSACEDQESPQISQEGTSRNEMKKEVREATEAVEDYTKEKNNRISTYDRSSTPGP